MDLLISVLLPSLIFSAQQTQHGEEDHAAGIDRRGDHEIGFSHDKTAHHFILLPDGGSIEVLVGNPNDSATREEIQRHMVHIAMMFQNNDFEIPMLIHDRVPPGVPTMKQKHDVISYSYAPTERGGHVRIKTADPQALRAIHEFLVFQIRDHRTGDPEEIRAH